MRHILLAAAATLALALPAKAEDVTVAVTAIVEHPALDAARDGVKEALEAAGYKEGENLYDLSGSEGEQAGGSQSGAAERKGDRTHAGRSPTGVKRPPGGSVAKRPGLVTGITTRRMRNRRGNRAPWQALLRAARPVSLSTAGS